MLTTVTTASSSSFHYAQTTGGKTRAVALYRALHLVHFTEGGFIYFPRGKETV